MIETGQQPVVRLSIILISLAVIVVGLMLMWYAPCVTGEIRTTTAVSQDGKLLVATAPVCPEEGQTVVRMLLMGLLIGGIVIGGIKVVMDADAKGDAAVAVAGMTMGYAPRSTIDLQARAGGQDAYLTVAQVEAMLAKARLDDARTADLRGQSDWASARPALPPTTPQTAATAGQTGGGGNGSNGHQAFKAEDWS